MSQENVEIVRRVIEIFNEAGMGAEATWDFYAADIVFEEPPEQPGASVVVGRDAALRTFQQFDSAWEEHRSEPEEFRVIDDERVLMLSIEHFRGRDGIELSQRCGNLFTLRKGKIIRQQAFWERDTALAAVEPSE
jgi:ketosteroid isomerase-like protein